MVRGVRAWDVSERARGESGGGKQAQRRRGKRQVIVLV